MKLYKSEVEYTDYSPDQRQRCELCVYFNKMIPGGVNTCTIVNGMINRHGNCNGFDAKQAVDFTNYENYGQEGK